jgi:signal transduction histidine kinase
MKQEIPFEIQFKDKSLTEIQSMITDLYNQLESNKKDILLEREKLLDHFHYEEEGISFFTASMENIYTNSHFIQYLNMLLNQPVNDTANLFEAPVFKEFVQFLKNPGEEHSLGKKMYVGGNHFFIQLVIFDDKSFEIIIRDITEVEKDNLDRVQMTNNIAHELRTPVTSIRGYLETLIEHKDLSETKKEDYIERAYKQVIRLSEIIQDVILLSKTTDAPQYFTLEDINIYDVLQDLFEDTKEIIEKTHTVFKLQMPEKMMIRGNQTLLYSIFWNLCNNAMKYAGENKIITINNYKQDKEFYYFSFSDNGKGIENKYLDHIFQRFYRINEGRTRDKGGSGLGLAIVKDAVKFHHGEIQAKNRPEGGLEFLFTIRKW